MPEPDPSLLLAALLHPDLWAKYWQRDDNLFAEPVLLNDPDGTPWQVDALDVPGDGTLLVTTRAGTTPAQYRVSIEEVTP